MESIKYYKLVSPYPEDKTMNCKLTMGDIDENFLAFKDYDIKSAIYDIRNMVIHIVRNNGENININISSVRDEIDEKIREATSGITPSTLEINLSGEVSEDGILTLHWTDSSGQHETEISGFVAVGDVKHDSTLKGNGTDENPIGIADTELTGRYKAVRGIVSTLPEPGTSDIGRNETTGDRWITRNDFSLFGRVYNRNGMEAVKAALDESESVWRVATQEDFDTLFNFVDVCNEPISGDTVGEFQGNVCGKMLKSINYWPGNENLDDIGFCAYPSGYAINTMLYGADEECRFWTDTKNTNGKYFVKGFTYSDDRAMQIEEENNAWYSIRLVRDMNDANPVDFVNLLGNTYKVINIPEINQAWIAYSLQYDDDSNNNEQYLYDHSGLMNEKYILNHWNGKFWEKKQLNDGDMVSVASGNTVTEYTCVENNSGDQELIKGIKYKVEGGKKYTVIDAGWY